MVETVENIMTTVVTCATPDYRLTELEKVMEKHNIRCLPIIGNDGDCIGVVTPIDILHWHRLQKAVGDAQAKDIFTRPVVTVEPQLSVIDAIKLMVSKNIHHLIVEREGELVGILSAVDFLEKLYLKENASNA